jgi:thiol-disulfide isomerase/thioredoxin
MKKIVFILLLFCVTTYAQEYDFISKDFVEISSMKFQEIKEHNKNLILDIFFENGKLVPKKFMDSVIKKRSLHKFKQRFFKDSIQNKFASVLRKMTEQELKDKAKFDQNYFNEGVKNMKNLKGILVDSLFLEDLLGNKYSMNALKGKVIVLNFWFTKCAPCIKEIPDLNKMVETYGKDKVVYFAITFDKKELIEKFLEKFKIDFTIIPDDKKTINQFKIQYYPTNLIFDQNGKIVFVNEFFMKNMIEDMNKTIKKLVEK